jgi:hypothetical protein
LSTPSCNPPCRDPHHPHTVLGEITILDEIEIETGTGIEIEIGIGM